MGEIKDELIPIVQAIGNMLVSKENEINAQRESFEKKFAALSDKFDERLSALENSNASNKMMHEFKKIKDEQIAELRNCLAEKDSEIHLLKEIQENLKSEYTHDLEEIRLKYEEIFSEMNKKHDIEMKDMEKIVNNLENESDREIRNLRLQLEEEKESHRHTAVALEGYIQNIIHESYGYFLRNKDNGMFTNYESFVQMMTVRTIIDRFNKLRDSIITDNRYSEEADIAIDDFIRMYNIINPSKAVKRQVVNIGDEYSEKIHQKAEADNYAGEVKRVILRGIVTSNGTVLGECTSLVELQ